MSLQVWLPLNGNLENKGCSNAVVTAVTTAGYSDGKLGKALSSGKIKIDAEYVSNIFNKLVTFLPYSRADRLSDCSLFIYIILSICNFVNKQFCL